MNIKEMNESLNSVSDLNEMTIRQLKNILSDKEKLEKYYQAIVHDFPLGSRHVVDDNGSVMTKSQIQRELRSDHIKPVGKASIILDYYL